MKGNTLRIYLGVLCLSEQNAKKKIKNLIQCARRPCLPHLVSEIWSWKLQIKNNTASCGCDRSAVRMAYILKTFPFSKFAFTYLLLPLPYLWNQFGCGLLCFQSALLGLEGSSVCCWGRRCSNLPVLRFVMRFPDIHMNRLFFPLLQEVHLC